MSSRADAKHLIGKYANVHSDDSKVMSFGLLLKCVWSLHYGKETMGHKCAEVLASILDGEEKPTVQPVESMAKQVDAAYREAIVRTCEAFARNKSRMWVMKIHKEHIAVVFKEKGLNYVE